ncbi:hypothetical protein ACIQGT_13985 [Streptomyces sp. NPDC093108]|uniref:hypothetical protein n=1 Tax=unclassified Streptomyces TaxID=2593676 RepID=UPI003827B904
MPAMNIQVTRLKIGDRILTTPTAITVKEISTGPADFVIINATDAGGTAYRPWDRVTVQSS